MDTDIRKQIVSSHGHLISSSKSSVFVAHTNSHSVEDSGPPSPNSGPIINFAQVAAGIYRSSFPMAGNFEHLKSLGLKTILTLVPEEYPQENVDFMAEHDIQHSQIPIPAHKRETDSIPLRSIAKVLELLMDRSYHPILVHCNKGKHRTGCMIACYRKIHEWSYESVVTEYRKYAGSKYRVLDEKFFSTFDADTMLERLMPKMLPTPPSSEKDDDT